MKCEAEGEGGGIWCIPAHTDHKVLLLKVIHETRFQAIEENPPTPSLIQKQSDPAAQVSLA